MAPRLDIQALCAKHRNETPHAEHVARLALHLFDALRSTLGLPVSERKLLEAAARLHDVGYAIAPDGHAAAGAAAIRDEGLAGFDAAARAVVARAVLLHGGGADADGGAVRPAVAQRALRLAAVLRMADALDHGHVQDAAIESVSVACGRIRVAVRCPAYGGSVARANAKSDLFRRVYAMDVAFAGAPPDPEQALLEGVLTPDTGTVEAARLILVLQYRLMQDNAALALAGSDPEHLHDLRVAARRARFALRFFAGPLAGTSAAACERELKAFGRKTGVARDAQVWRDFALRVARERGLEAAAGWPGFLEELGRLDARRTAGLRRMLRGAPFGRLAGSLARLVRLELPELAARDRTRFGAFAARRVHALFRRLQRTELDPRTATAEALHETRKNCRRERYRVEFGCAVLGAPIRRLAVLLRVLTNTLGTAHDVDVWTEGLGRAAHPCPAELLAVMRATRDAALADFEAAWKKLHQRRRRSDVVRELRAASSSVPPGTGFGDW